MGSMTFEEAKREIERLDDCLWSEFEKNPNPKTYGEARAYEEACHILDEVDTEPVGKPDKMTLTELALGLRKLFKFKYLAVDSYGDEITLWEDKPVWDGAMWWAGDSSYLLDFYANRLGVALDLAEYRDADGNIDYSKCIVEVE